LKKQLLRPLLLFVAVCLAREILPAALPEAPAPIVVQINLDGVVQPISAEYVVHGIEYASQVHASAILLELSTPGGLEDSMRDIIRAIVNCPIPVITYVAPSGSRSASAGFFILLSGDLAVMAPGTNTGAAHPVTIGGMSPGKTMESKIENDAAAFIRSIAGHRGRNAKLAEEGVRESKSYTDQEALKGHLIDAIESSPQDIFKQFDGRTITRFNGSTTVLHLAGARIDEYRMPDFKRFLSWVADPNIAFILGAIGVLGLYVEFTHPGFVAPGVIGAICLLLAMFGFHLMPVNYVGVVLIILALILFALEAKLTSHGVLAAGGIVSMIIGSLILINSPWPGARIRLPTTLVVTLPLAVISVILMRFAWLAKLRKAVTGSEGLVGEVGVVRVDLEPAGKVFVHGELWDARAEQAIPQGAPVRVRKIEGLTLIVEPVDKSS
jgi:membrane-bound serine protease (ClpP class)